METFDIPASLQGWELDTFVWDNYQNIIGIDEVGRGALAGPVITCALSLKNSGIDIKGLNDSKKLSLQQRISLFHKILPHVQYLGLGVALSVEIDHINILQSTRLAMYRALENLELATPHHLESTAILVDGLFLPHPKWTSIKLIKGDARSPHIMAASIVAKVVRDYLMELYHDKYPQFHFHKNRGYGSLHHRASLEKEHTPVHRKTFAPLKEILAQKGT